MYDSFGSWLSGVHGFWNFREAEPLKVRAERIINMVAGLITKKKTLPIAFFPAQLCLNISENFRKITLPACTSFLLPKRPEVTPPQIGNEPSMYDWLTCLISWKRKRRTIGFANVVNFYMYYVLRVNKLWKYSLFSFVCHCLSLIATSKGWKFS